MPAAPLRVAVVEDDPGLRGTLAEMLHEAEGFACVGAWGRVEEALAVFDGRADAVLMDIHLPGVSGVEGVRLLRARYPQLPVVMLTVYDDPARIFEALQAGASGYLLKRTPPADLLAAVADVAAGGAPMSAAIARRVVQSFHAPAPPTDIAAVLTPREREVLTLVARGYRSREIADALAIGVETVRSHLRRIYEKLHVRSRAEAAMRYTAR